MFETMFFSVSSYVSTPGQCYARQTSKGTFFVWERYVFMFKKMCLWTRPKNRFRTDSEIFKLGIVEKFSFNFPKVENILMLYIRSCFFGHTRHTQDSAGK